MKLSDAMALYRVTAQTEGRSPKTIKAVLASVRYFWDFLGEDVEVDRVTIYQAHVESSAFLTVVSKFHEKWVEWLILPAVSIFLAWRFMAMLARVWQVETNDAKLGRDNPA